MSDILSRLLGNTFSNICQSFLDNYIEKNVEFRAKSGMKEQIVRQMLRNCCDFCRKLAGVYEYGTEPQEVYMRHDNCRCLVTHRTAAGHYVNVHSKVETDTYKQQRMMALKELDQDGEMEELFQKRRRLARAKNKIYDATEEWFYHATPNSHRVEEAKEELVRELLEKRSNETITKLILDYRFGEEERRIAKELENIFGGDIKLLPRVEIPQKNRMADFLINGEYWDLKAIKKIESKKAGYSDSVFSAVKHGKGQSMKFVVDISSGVITEEQAIQQATAVFYRDRTKETQKIMIINNGKIVKVLEK